MLAQRVVPVVARNAILDATRSVGVRPQCARLEEADVVVDVLAGIARFAGAGPVTAAIAREKKKKVESELNGIGGGRRNDMTYKIWPHALKVQALVPAVTAPRVREIKMNFMVVYELSNAKGKPEGEREEKVSTFANLCVMEMRWLWGMMLESGDLLILYVVTYETILPIAVR